MDTKNKISTNVLQFTAFKHQNRAWRELIKDRQEFQFILRLLVEQEERESFTNLNWLFYTRRALCVCNPNIVRFFLRDLGGYLFHVVAQLETVEAKLATSWLHEDGIQLERDAYFTVKDHPVHKILCLNDLYSKSTHKLNLNVKKWRPSEAALSLMLVE